LLCVSTLDSTRTTNRLDILVTANSKALANIRWFYTNPRSEVYQNTSSSLSRTLSIHTHVSYHELGLFITGGTTPPFPPLRAAHPFILLLTPSVFPFPTPPTPPTAFFRRSILVSCIQTDVGLDGGQIGGLMSDKSGGFATKPGGGSRGSSTMGCLGRGGDEERNT
jgi:hypothetical protein